MAAVHGAACSARLACTYGNRSANLNFKKFIFGHVTVIEFEMCCCVTNFIKIMIFRRDRAIWRFNHFQDGARRSAILNLCYLNVTSVSLLLCAKFYWNQLLRYGQKTIFNMAAIRHLELKKIHSTVIQFQNMILYCGIIVYQISSKLDDFSLR